MTIELHPADALVDDELTVVVTDAPSTAELVVLAESTRLGRTWCSSRPLVTDAAGTATVDGAPWLWSLESDGIGRHHPGSDASWEVRFTLQRDGERIAEATATRRYVAADVTRFELREGELRGTYYAPARPQSTRAALVFSGGDGGHRADVAALLASRGVPALALAMWAFDDRPQWMIEIPLEYADAAIAWLRDASGATKVATVGMSMGGCLSLLLASHHPDVDAACSINGCGWVPQVRAVGGATSGPVTAPFTRGGIPLPFAGPDAPPELREAARIPVERIDGDVLLVTGGDDQTWTATPFAEQVASWRRDARLPVEHVDFSQAGHLVFVPNAPHTLRSFEFASGYRMAMGGTAAADARASADAWPRLLNLLLSPVAVA